MLPQKAIHFAALVALLSSLAAAQQNCISTCQSSANVLTQLKSCSGCGDNDFSCFCRCPQYMSALLSCAEQYCSGTDVTDSIVTFCADQGVTLSYSSTFLSYPTTSASSDSSDVTSTSSDSVASALASALRSASATATGDSASGDSFTATDPSDVSAYLASAVPSTSQSDSSAACFVNSPYTYYSTPTWYSSLPAQVQTYYSSVNQGNTAACTLSPSQVAALAAPSTHHGSGLSGGAIAGIVIGAILAALLLLALLYLCLRRRRRARRNADAAARANEKGFGPGTAMPAQGMARSYPNGNPRPAHSNPPFPGSTPGPAGGAMVGGANNANQPNSHTTTTTTRTTIRSRPRNPAPVSSPSQQRPPPVPISQNAPVDDGDQSSSVPRRPVGGKAYY